jgi:NADH-quinone oxidoreductase subunit E
MKQVDKIIASYHNDKSALVQILLQIQKEEHWLSEDALKRISKKLDIPLNQIYHVATFYRAFSLKPKGRHTACVCLGTACHVRGAPKILDKAEQILGIKAGETTKDMKFTLERVNCLGCCALGPVIVVDEEAHGNLTTANVEEVFKKYE